MARSPLNSAISSKAVDCTAGLHYFRQTKRRGIISIGGPCQNCGAELVDWKRLHTRDLSDVDYTIKALLRERVRHEYWHKDFDEAAVNHARRKGRIALDAAVAQRLRSSVGREKNPREGRQTPYTGNVIYYAQHAVAACCRRCIECWHGIEGNRVFTDEEFAYLECLIKVFLRRRITWLADEPQSVPPRRGEIL